MTFARFVIQVLNVAYPAKRHPKPVHHAGTLDPLVKK
jgi:hypothetical protein